MSIGERICTLRTEKDISQYRLAQLLEVSRQAVSKWENDLSAPDTIKLIQLADVLDVDVEYLATGKQRQLLSPAPATVEKIVEHVVEVEKIVEKPVIVERQVEVEKIVVRPVIRRRIRIKYIRNPLEFFCVGVAGLLVGVILGFLI